MITFQSVYSLFRYEDLLTTSKMVVAPAIILCVIIGFVRKQSIWFDCLKEIRLICILLISFYNLVWIQFCMLWWSLCYNKIPHAIHLMGFLKPMGILAWLIWRFFTYLQHCIKENYWRYSLRGYIKPGSMYRPVIIKWCANTNIS